MKHFILSLSILFLVFACQGPGKRAAMQKISEDDTVQSVFFSKVLQDTLDMFIEKAGIIRSRQDTNEYYFYSANIRVNPKNNDTLLHLLGSVFGPHYHINFILSDKESFFKPVGTIPMENPYDILAASYHWPTKEYPDSIFNETPMLIASATR